MFRGLLCFGNHGMDIDGSTWGLSVTMGGLLGTVCLRPPVLVWNIYSIYEHRDFVRLGVRAGITLDGIRLVTASVGIRVEHHCIHQLQSCVMVIAGCVLYVRMPCTWPVWSQSWGYWTISNLEESFFPSCNRWIMIRVSHGITYLPNQMT